MKRRVVLNTNFDMDKFKYTYSDHARRKVLDLLERREKAILSKSELIEKFEDNEAFCLQKGSGKKFYVYFDKKGVCPEAKVHFYNEDGDLMFTFPWNGGVGRYKTLKAPFNGLAKNYKRIEISCTESRILVKDLAVVSHYMAPETIDENVTVFDENGKREFVFKPKSFGNYPKNSEAVINGKPVGDLFLSASLDGDRYIDFCKKMADVKVEKTF